MTQPEISGTEDDRRRRKNEQRQYHRERAAIAFVVELDDFLDENGGDDAGVILIRKQNPEEIERLERSGETDQQGNSRDFFQQRQFDVPERLPRARAVESRCLQNLIRDAGQSREKDDHEESGRRPAGDHRDGQQRPALIEHSGHNANAVLEQKPEYQTDHKGEHRIYLFHRMSPRHRLRSNFVWDFASPVSTLNSVFATAKSGFGLPSLSYLVSGLSNSVFTVLGGVYTISLLLALSLIGFVILVRFHSSVSRFLVAWMFVCCASVVVAGSDFVFDRFLFLMPWGILSSLGLFSVQRVFHTQFARQGKKAMIPVWLAMFFVFVLLMNFSLHYIFNINIW